MLWQSPRCKPRRVKLKLRTTGCQPGAVSGQVPAEKAPQLNVDRLTACRTSQGNSVLRKASKKLDSSDRTTVTSLIPRTFSIFILTVVIVSTISAQQPKLQASPSPSPTPTPVESDQEPVRVFTEEVRLPVL